MSLSYTTQPTADGKYSAYLPIKFVATETANPDFLYFKIRKSDGTAIDEIPYYKAYNIDNEFHFDAYAYLKAIFDVRTKQGFSTVAIEELTDIYGKFEVVVNTTAILTGGLISNHFFAFASLETRKYLNEETANYGVNDKQLMFSNDFHSVSGLMPSRDKGVMDRVSLFVTERYLFLDTYSVDKPNAGSTVSQQTYIDLNAYIGKLVSVPLNSPFITANFLKVGGGLFFSKIISFRLSLGGTIHSISPAIDYHYIQPQHVFFNNNTECNFLEFVYINKYGVKENITFNATQDESLKTKSSQFLRHGFNHEDETNVFNTSADRQKINQQTTITKKVEGTKMLIKRIEQVKDFLTSPVVWSISEQLPVVISDGSYKLTKENKGLEVSFKYSNSQTKLSFL